MKKMMMMAAVVMAVGMVQAAAVQWSSGQMTGPNSVLIGASTDYLATVYFFSDAGGTTPINAGTGTEISKDTSALSAFAGTTANVFTGGATAGYYARMVITSDDNLWIRTSDIRQLGTVPTTGNLNVNFSSGAGFLGGTGGGTLWTEGWEAVPEPTSFALLALGAAVIGLRRKVRK